jgi:hypothetical protein
MNMRAALCGVLLASTLFGAELKVRITWGHESPVSAPYYVRLVTENGAEIRAATGYQLEPGEGINGDAWQSTAGAGDIDGVGFTLVYPQTAVTPLQNLHIIWADLIAQSDADSARRLNHDPAFHPDTPKLTVIRTFYSYMASAFSHSVYEPVEHRWTHGQYFGPPSADGAWCELFRNMLVREVDDQTLLLAQAPPRQWLKDGLKIDVQRAPTYFGPVSYRIESHAAEGRIIGTIQFERENRPRTLLVRFRHPEEKPMRSVAVDGQAWKDLDAAKEWVRIENPVRNRYSLVVSY